MILSVVDEATSPPLLDSLPPPLPPTIGLLDCGMVSQIDDELRDELENALIAAVHGDAKAVVGVVAVSHRAESMENSKRDSMTGSAC